MRFAPDRHRTSSNYFLILAAFACLFVACSRGVDGTNLSAENINPAAVSNNDASEPIRADVPREEAVITALQVFKKGDSKIERADPNLIPKAPPIPHVYAFKTGYRITSNAVFSEAMLTVTVPASEESDFQKARLLSLQEDDMYPDGYVWRDCTMLQADRGKEFLPDPVKKTVSCHFAGAGIAAGKYFLLVSQTAEPRTTAVAKIKMGVEKSETQIEKGQISYSLAVTNQGPQDVGEVNFHSTFSHAELVEVNPSNGNCKRARFGSSDSSVVCHLGELKVGQKAMIEFTARSDREARYSASDKDFNKQWVIRGFSRKGPTELVVSADVFHVRPLIQGK